MNYSISKRLQVFVSSTYTDLIPECQAVLEAILTLGYSPGGLGLFSGTQGISFDLIRQWIDASDVYLLLLGNRYGFIDPKARKSQIHLEYDYAIAQSKPIMALIVHDSAIADRVYHYGRDVIEDQYFHQLAQFRTLAAAQNAHFWSTPADIHQILGTQLPIWMTQAEVGGWGRSHPLARLEITAPQNTPDSDRDLEDLAVLLRTLLAFAQSLQAVAGRVSAAHPLTEQASAAVHRGGEAVDSTVAGLLQLRTRMADSARTTKRLAEVTQQITKVVKLISQIAARTNLMALNASIEVNRLGLRGHGFVLIANELRQLANHTAKVSQAVEQIAQPLQERTNRVLTAMEEGVQQMIFSAQQVEQIKQSWEDIDQISAQLHQFVWAITEATAEHTETSESVCALLQSMDWAIPLPPDSAQKVTELLQNLPPMTPDQAAVTLPI